MGAWEKTVDTPETRRYNGNSFWVFQFPWFLEGGVGSGDRNNAGAHAEAYRQRILDRASELFYQFGFKRVTMDDLSHALGISKKTLYQFARGKDALIEMFVDELADRTFGQAVDVFDETDDVVGLTHRLVEFLSSRMQFISSAMVMDLQRHWPHLWERINARRMKVLERYLTVIERSVDRGILRPEVHPKVMTRMVQVLVTDIVNPKTYLELEITPQQAIETLMTVLLYGALSEGAREERKED